MTREEQNKCFALLGEFYPNSRRLQSKTQRAAWRLVLEHYGYPDVKDAIVNHAARSNFFPDVADITGNLTPEPTKAEREAAASDMRRMERMLELLREKVGDAV